MDNISITNIREKNHGALVLHCDVAYTLYDRDGDPKTTLLSDVSYFCKGDENWVQLPNRAWKEDEKWKHKNLVRFDDLETHREYCGMIAEAIRLAISSPQVSPVAVNDDEVVPF